MNVCKVCGVDITGEHEYPVKYCTIECVRLAGMAREEDKADPIHPILPTDSEERKQLPIFSGVLNYFPLAIAAVSRVSKRGNDKHNAGQALHWSRGKSMDHADCIARHLIDIETVDRATGEYEDAAALAWRALALLQEMEERRLGKAPSRGSRLAAPCLEDLDKLDDEADLWPPDWQPGEGQ